MLATAFASLVASDHASLDDCPNKVPFCRDELMLANRSCRDHASRKRSTAWLLRCPVAAFVPAAIAVAEARQRAGQILRYQNELVEIGS
jgi:hypothetical protein